MLIGAYLFAKRSILMGPMDLILYIRICGFFHLIFNSILFVYLNLSLFPVSGSAFGSGSYGSDVLTYAFFLQKTCF